MKTETKNKVSKFQIGETVYNSISQKNEVISGAPQWNGLTYMYSFEGSEMRAGEMYLSAPKTETLKTEKNLGKLTFDSMLLPSRKFIRLLSDHSEIGVINQTYPRNVKVYEDQQAEANAAFICKAVNNYDRLLEMCVATLEDLLSGQVNDLDTQEQARENLIDAIRRAQPNHPILKSI